MIRIAVTGPESTGKSTLTRQLAEMYKTAWVPEYAREYLNHLEQPYSFDDVEKIARKQIESENKLSKTANGILFCDTELIVIKIWMEHKYKYVPGWINQEINKRKYDMFLLCNIDIPWIPDPLRENPDLRKFFFDWFINELEKYNKPYMIISGDQNTRLNTSIEIIGKIISVKTSDSVLPEN